MKRSIVLPVLVLVLGVGLGSCQGSPETRATATLAALCDSLASVIRSATVLRAEGRLTEDQIRTVGEGIQRSKRYCSSDSEVDPADGVRSVREILFRINDITGERA